MIVRAPKPVSNFYTLDKKISEDKRLSWEARGLLIFLLGKPDNWSISPTNLVNETSGSSRKNGRDAVYAILKELENTGYLVRKRQRNSNGTLGQVVSYVNEQPDTAKPDTAKPDTVQPDTVQPDTVQPDTVQPDTVQPDTANPTLISTDGNKDLKELSIDNSKDTPNANASDAIPLLPKTKPSEKKKKDGIVTSEDLQKLGVEKKHADSWVVVRNDKGLTLTESALELAAKEAAKVGLTIAEAVEVSAGHGWAGFKASWYQRLLANDTPQRYQTQQTVEVNEYGRPLNKQELLEKRNRQIGEEWLARHEAEDKRNAALAGISQNNLN